MAIDINTINLLLNYKFGDNSGKDIFLGLIAFIFLLAAMNIFRLQFLTKLKRLAQKTSHEFDDLLVDFISEIHWPFYFFCSFYIASKFIVVSSSVKLVMDYMMILFIVFYSVTGLYRLIDYITDKEIETLVVKSKKPNISMFRFLNKVAKFLILVLAALMLMSNLGINISSLIAGLGITGIAIAFSLQRILEDIFSSFSIYFDKPFEEGDSIVIDQDSGVVKHIGLKSTRILTTQGEELVVSNKEMTSVRVHNFKKLQRRRNTFTLALEYATSTAKLKKIKTIMEEIVKPIEKAELDWVHFKSFGDSGLIYEIRYYVDSSDYDLFQDIQEKINLAIKERFEKEKINFAFPSNTVYLKR